MQYIYICGAVSEEMNNALGRSVAGNKFSLNMAKALDKRCNGNLTIISTAAVPQSAIDKWNGEIWPGKKMHLAKRGTRFLLAELKLRRSILQLLRNIQKTHPNEKIAVFIENSPFAAATACEKFSKRTGAACYSITIDTPFAGEFKGTGLAGHINSWMFLRGRKALRSFNGLISFTEHVKQELQVDIPFCSFAIGCNEDAIPEGLPIVTSEKTAVYAGTLIYYNGTQELLQAFAMLGPEYQLHIYGYGPLEQAVQQAAKEYENIHFHGRFAPEETTQILGNYALLINPRRIDPDIENFTFPSKLVDYILTGKSVLSSDFKTLPPAYREFVYILEDLQPETIATGVRNVFGDSLETRQTRGKAGIDYVKNNQTYEIIVEQLIRFVEG